MKKGLFIIVSLLFVVTTILSACSGATNSSGENMPKETSPEDSGSEQIKLSIAWWGSQTRHDYTQQLLDLYTEQNPHVTFEATLSGWDGYFDKLSAQAAGDTLPDIIQMDYAYIATFSNNGLLTDMQPYVEDQSLDLSNVDQNIIGSGIVNGELTGIPISSAAMAVTYNPDVFAEAGLEVPTPDWTWQEFLESMYLITDKTGKFGTEKLGDLHIFSYWARQHGASVFADDGTKLGYDDDAILVEFIEMLKELQDRKSLPNPDEWAQIESRGKEANPTVTGDAGVRFDWSNFAVITSESNPNLKLVTPPKRDGGTDGLWIKPGMFFSVAKSSKHQDEAAKFINWFVNNQEANDIIAAERGIPVSSEVREQLMESLTPQQQDMFAYIDLAIQHSSEIDPPEPSGVAEVTKEFSNAVNLVMYDQLSAEEAAQSFRSKANQILARNAN